LSGLKFREGKVNKVKEMKFGKGKINNNPWITFCDADPAAAAIFILLHSRWQLLFKLDLNRGSAFLVWLHFVEPSWTNSLQQVFANFDLINLIGLPF
jgi:hypothetical protein